MRTLAVLMILALSVGPAFSQDREFSQRQVLMDLAYVLGEAHALRQACEGLEDQYWRTRMIRLLETEGADRGFEQRLRDIFNAGFRAREREYPRCSARAQEVESEVAARGQRLAQRLAASR